MDREKKRQRERRDCEAQHAVSWDTGSLNGVSVSRRRKNKLNPVVTRGKRKLLVNSCFLIVVVNHNLIIILIIKN